MQEANFKKRRGGPYLSRQAEQYAMNSFSIFNFSCEVNSPSQWRSQFRVNWFMVCRGHRHSEVTGTVKFTFWCLNQGKMKFGILAFQLWCDGDIFLSEQACV